MMRLVFLVVLAALALGGCLQAADSPDVSAVDAARAATANLATPEAAEAAGYQVYSPYIPHHGVHYRHAEYAAAAFDPTRPPLLVFVRDAAGNLVLGGVEYAVPRTTNIPPDGFPGSDDVWGVHEASCHFVDGRQAPERDRTACPAASPESGAQLLLWHADQWTLHVWLHVANADGMFKTLNPAVP